MQYILSQKLKPMDSSKEIGTSTHSNTDIFN